METSLANNKKVISQELEISMNQLTTWKDKVVIQFMKLSSERLEATFVMEDIIHFIGWDLDSMELKLLSILQPLLMDCLNHFGQSKDEMPPSQIITLPSTLTELELKFIQTFLQVEIKRVQRDNLAISTAALMLLLQMDPEPQDFQEPVMESLSQKLILTCADKSKIFGDLL